jgi:hypothetical protein
MSQIATPLDGGRKDIQISPNPIRGIFISSQYREAKRLNPVPTEWFEGGKPIYNRLPAVSERYRIDFGFDGNSAFVYLPVGQSIFGPNSLEVKPSNDNQVIVIKGGTVVWRHGEFKIDPTIIDVREVGFGNTRYLLAYQFFLDDAPYDGYYQVSDYNLRGYPMDVNSNTDSVIGWRFLPKYAFYGTSPFEWRNYDSVFSSYSEDAKLTCSFPNAAALTKINLRCPKGTAVTGGATLSLAAAKTGPFEAVSSTTVQSDTEGQFFEFDLPEGNYATTWSVEWEDRKIAIRDVAVSGIISLERKPAESLSRISLVAYPQTTLPKTALDSLGNEVPAVYCKLAFVDIDDSFRVTRIVDLRESVNTDYRPISEWLTRPWDTNLISLHGQVEKYSELWMSPQNCLVQEYSSLENKLISVDS